MSKEGQPIDFRTIGETIETPKETEEEREQRIREKIKQKKMDKERNAIEEIKEKNKNWKEDIEKNYVNKTIKDVLNRAESERVSLYTTIDKKLHEVISEFLNLKKKEKASTASEDEKQFLKAETSRRVFDVYQKFFIISKEEREARKKMVELDEKTPGTIQHIFIQHIFDEVLLENVGKLNDELAQMIDAVLKKEYVEQTLISEIHKKEQTPADITNIKKFPEKKRGISRWFKKAA